MTLPEYAIQVLQITSRAQDSIGVNAIITATGRKDRKGIIRAIKHLIKLKLLSQERAKQGYARPIRLAELGSELAYFLSEVESFCKAYHTLTSSTGGTPKKGLEQGHVNILWCGSELWSAFIPSIIAHYIILLSKTQKNGCLLELVNDMIIFILTRHITDTSPLLVPVTDGSVEGWQLGAIQPLLAIAQDALRSTQLHVENIKDKELETSKQACLQLALSLERMTIPLSDLVSNHLKRDQAS